MDSALAWIGQIAQWFGQLIPRWMIIPTTHRGLKFVGGSRVVVAPPGIMWYWLARTEAVMYPVALQTTILRTQTLTTADDKTITVGGLIEFEIDDLGKLYPFIYEPDQLIEDIALAAVNAVVCDKTWDELKALNRSGRLARQLTSEARQLLRS